MELRCVCGSEDLHIHRYRDDFATCLGCGHTGDIEGDFMSNGEDKVDVKVAPALVEQSSDIRLRHQEQGSPSGFESQPLHQEQHRLGCGHTGDIEGDFLVKEKEFPAIWRDEEEVA